VSFSKRLCAACGLLLVTVLPTLPGSPAAATPQPLRPPNGTYVYTMAVGGSTVFNSTIVVDGSGSTFGISETTKLPNGAIATTSSTWSCDTLLPRTVEVHQGKVTLRARITPAALTLDGTRVSFPRIPGTSYVLPSVGLLATIMIYPYVVSAHPGESFTQAEIQNNQTVVIRPDSAPSPAAGLAGDTAIALIKNEEYGKGADQERIVTWLSDKTGVMDAAQADPGGAKITLLTFKPQ
jgi:hypothetical protein